MDMFIELNEKGKCSTQITPDTTLYLKVFPPTLVPPQVRDHDVPILMVRAEEFVSAEWDLTTQQVYWSNIDILLQVYIRRILT